MLSSTLEVHKQLAAALAEISDADFPRKWETLLPVHILHSLPANFVPLVTQI
jgi:hypothetical protein